MENSFKDHEQLSSNNNEDNKSKVVCPRCGGIYWLSPGEMILCLNKTNSPFASNGICFLTIGGPLVKKNNNKDNNDNNQH